jgi:signal peptidase I
MQFSNGPGATLPRRISPTAVSTASRVPKWFRQAQRLIEDGELIVPEDSYFVLGDNRDDSYDSRYWGFVPRENVVGRPLMIYWSMDREGEAWQVQPSDKLSHLTVNVTQWLNGLRWHRMLRIPQ